MQTFSEGFVGTDGGPPSTNAYKRAVYRQAPRSFTVEVLPPQKQGSAYSYGMRITPSRSDSSDRHSTISGISAASGNSSGSSASGSGSAASIMTGTTTTALTTEYEVWRRWEDCLWFQDLLETQYAQMSREKVKRLQAGKGVKKNGVYPHEDPNHHQRAASFESLPPGPDPTMIARDVHEFLPKLTKKGTLFKASKDTIQQRNNEFKALIETLLKEGEDVPTLITELRQLRVVRDFFGFWRRDLDRYEKEHGKSFDKASIRTRSDSTGPGSPATRNSSMFGSSFGMYFSASNLSLQLPTTFSLPSDAFPNPERLPRRPPIMQGGKGAMLPVSPTVSEPAPMKTNDSSNNSSSSTLQVPRQRAQTMQGTGVSVPSASIAEGSSSGNSIRSTKTNSTSSGSSQSTTAQSIVSKPPASAPAGVSFTFKMHTSDSEDSLGRTAEDGYISDAASLAESTLSTQTYQASVSSRPPRTPRSAPPGFSPGTVHGRDPVFSGSVKGKQRAGTVDLSEPIIVNLAEGLDVPVDENDLPFDEDDSVLVLREHEHLMPRTLDPLLESAELEFSVGGRLQDLTIHEEDDEREEVSTLHDYRSELAHSELGHPISRVASPLPRGAQTESTLFEEEPIPEPIPAAIPRAPRRVGSPPAGNRNGMLFTPTASLLGHGPTDDRDTLSLDGHSIISHERPQTAGSVRPRTPMSPPPKSAARIEALNALTADNITRIGSPGPALAARRLTASTLSTQASSRSSGSSGFSTSHTIDTNTSLGVHNVPGRPISLGSVVSCADIDSRLTSSPIILHTPLYEEPDEFRLGAEDTESECRTATASPVARLEAHHYRNSVTSVQSFRTDCSADAVIPRSERSMSPPPPTNPRLFSGPGANLRRSFSSGSRPATRTSHRPAASVTNAGQNEDSEEVVDSYFYGVTSSPTTTEHIDIGALSPGREHNRGTLASPDNFPKPFQNRPAGQFHLPWTPPATQSSTPTSPNSRNSMISMDASIAPSMMSSIIDEANAISIKAAFGDHIVAFRADRGIALEEVRSKIHHKLVNQQNVKLSESFALMYKPPPAPSSSKPGGRARSSSVSSVGTSASEPPSLRFIFSQKDWQDAVNISGAKLTLHIINA